MIFTLEYIKELKNALKDKSLAPFHNRIQAVFFRSQDKTYAEIKQLLNLSHDTVWRLVKKYEKEGLTALTKDGRGGRRNSYLTFEEEAEFLEQALEAAQNGELVTASSLHLLYQEKIKKSSFLRTIKTPWVAKNNSSSKTSEEG
ncbi:helix-turn-helix domain-containing protein [Streptococcus sp. 19428wA2_WM07]|nr:MULTISPECIES: helix-turn-helix domain-containing protein [unclassified Streptococcus]MBF0806782.1 helix-turn-helix domain-containing protein [Streptococcus sp. 19428wA2_WM07]TFU25893.1 helix-turn-helix domain-containing protein [Streptococcus sp. WM07]